MNRKIKALIVDDEPLAQRVIEKYAQDVPSLEIVAKCANAIEAQEAINNHDIDLMFLDINMPKMTGISFLKILKDPPMVIITTAYSEYALEGFELDVIDYLKKPFPFERFFKAIQKVQEKLILNDPKANAELNAIAIQKSRGVDYERFIFIKSDKKNYKVNFSDICFIEALGDYIKVHTVDKTLVTYLSMKKMEALLPVEAFVRIHKSFIVNIHRIKTIEGNMVEVKNERITIGNNYKKQFQDLIDTYSAK
ncbi:MAG: LytTR family DNA-binding domain-containing protein [Bacteroidales bacterium]|nr:LytTR family DNA-binding domain-containing protein [Bacteroidales bacterium]MDY0215884.1 LytTR family DNA-binding domain-containing protein [Bacteroidales bacterium]